MEFRPIFSSLMRNKTGAILVAVQVALSLAILANALHIVMVRQEVMARPSGIVDEQDVFYLVVRDLMPRGHEAEVANQKREIDLLRAVPGVTSAAMVSQIPMSRSGSNSSVALDRKQTDQSANVGYYFTPDPLGKTWGFQFVEGRDFKPEEVMDVDVNATKDLPTLVIITKALADKLWPGQPAVGKSMLFGTGPTGNEVRVIGVIDRLQKPAAQVGMDGEYSSITAARVTGIPFSIYTARAEKGQLQRVMRDAEQALRKASPFPVIIESKTISDERKDRYRSDNALSWMLVAVCVLLLLVTASGIVGMASLWITQRRKQIGVRRALGARRVDILRYFITENFMITSLGVLSGVLMAIGLNQFLVSTLEMERLPIAYLAGGSVILWALGVMAVYGPAWRAASISPALATRSV